MIINLIKFSEVLFPMMIFSPGLRGLGITFLLTGLLALAFKTFIGMSF